MLQVLFTGERGNGSLNSRQLQSGTDNSPNPRRHQNSFQIPYL